MGGVTFVQMPFAAVERPSLALGLFTTSLKAARIEVETINANITFAEMVGLPAYFLVGQAGPHLLLGDWVFAESAFGQAARMLKPLRIGPAHFSVDRELMDAVLADGEHRDLGALLETLRRRAGELIEELADDILARRPRVVACTSMFDQHVASLALLQRVKTLDPTIFTVMGGANCAGVMGRATHLAFPALDFTVTGEFDQYASEFFRALRDAGGDARAVGPLPPNVLGPDYREGDQRDRGLPPTSLLADMDVAAIPDYDDYFDQIYSSAIGPYVAPTLPFETSRGCWWGAKHHCTFCGLNAEGMAFRKKTPERALREIRALTTRYGITRCAATDNIIDMSYFQTVLPGLAGDDRDYQIFYETKANLKREHVQALADAGCSVIQPGIESLHDETLQIMRKGTTACANIQLLKHCLELGVVPVWSILCNFPRSEPEWVAEVALDFPGLFHLFPPLAAIPIRIDRFSPYHQRPQDFGLNLDVMPTYRRVYPLDDSTLTDLAYFFQDVEEMDPRVVLHTRSADEMTRRWRTEFWATQRPLLVIEADDGERIKIRDTRSCARTGVHHLSGRLAALLRSLESPSSREALRGRLQAGGWGPVDDGDLAELLDELLEKRLVWRSSTQFVGLATLPPKRQIPETFAGVMVDIGKWLGEGRRRGCFS